MIDEFKTKDEYTEYGYRGVEELKRLQEIISNKTKEIEELKIEISNLRDKWQNSVQT
tara:strand:- start:157 stop:327 length:171 start_codon:yes stop_codon:yes gene_type:complete